MDTRSLKLAVKLTIKPTIVGTVLFFSFVISIPLRDVPFVESLSIWNEQWLFFYFAIALHIRSIHRLSPPQFLVFTRTNGGGS